MMDLNAWQLMLWIVLLAILLVPIVGVLANMIFIGYYKVKASYHSKMLTAITKAFELMTEAISKKDG